MSWLFTALLVLLLLLKVMGLRSNPAATSNEACSALSTSNTTLVDLTGMLKFIDGKLLVQSDMLSGEFTLVRTLLAQLMLYDISKEQSIFCMHLTQGTVDSFLGRELVAKASVTLNKYFAVGVLAINNTCWYNTSEMLQCRTNAVVAQSVIQTGVFVHSPLSERFWTSLNDDELFKPSLLMSLNTQTYHGSISPSWLSAVQVSGLNELFVNGNKWGRLVTLLGPLPNLNRLHLMGNCITELPPDAFANLTGLRSLHLQLNNLTALPAVGASVASLDLSHQDATEALAIPDHVVSSMSGMEVMLVNTPIQERTITRLWALPRLRILNCRGCSITEIQAFSETFNRSMVLNNIRLTSNKLTSLPPTAFKNLTALRDLYLDDNMFEKCPCSALKNISLLTTLDLSTNKIRYIDPHCFSGLRKLQKLFLRNNELTYIESSYFNNVTSLQYLYLSYNRLTKIEDDTFASMRFLHLYLDSNQLEDVPTLGHGFIGMLNISNNRLSRLNSTTVSVGRLDLSRNHITELECKVFNVLNLSYNSLAFIPDKMWPSLINVSLLDLGGNKFQCCHENISQLQSWINGSGSLIKNLNSNSSLTCLPNSGPDSVLLLSFINNGTLCYVFASRLGVELGVPLVVLLLCVFLFAAVARSSFFHLSYLRYFVRLRRRALLLDEDQSSSYVYDAFVCYSDKDFMWVAQQLLSSLESGTDGFRFCLKDRDFTPGAAIDKNIAAALKKSRRIIFVLTKDFLASTWCQWVLKLANHKMLREDRDYIILIELERLDRKHLPIHMQMLMDSRTYVEWPQDSTDQRRTNRCWQKLHDVLGHTVQKRTGKYIPLGTLLEV